MSAGGTVATGRRTPSLRHGTSVARPIVGTVQRAGAELGEMWSSSVQCHGGLRFVARTPLGAAADLVDAAVAPGRRLGEHVHLANAYSIAVADTTAAVAEVFSGPGAWLLPDGRPLTWASALRRDSPRLHQVRGPQFMLDVAGLGRDQQLRHYLLGGAPDVLRQLQWNLERMFPGIRIVGADSPPFTAPTALDLEQRDAAIRKSGAQVVWVGLGTPKQDLEAKRLADSLPVIALAVGAAFDYAAGTLSPAPRWVSHIGMEWFWRLLSEPRRLWKRYTVGNLRFIRAMLRSRGRGSGER